MSEPDGGTIRVVLCDDVPQLRMLLRYAFEEHADLDVVAEAGDGPGGLAAIEQARPDAVVLDLSMPGLDGLQVIPRIRGVSPHTAIVVFSGFTTARVATEALRTGADGYVEKGADLDEVAVAVRAAVARRRAAR